ncbi:endothelin-converting enzyme homolog [Periplaneta americana]|uniref:endothelin-converting enzyme homolog n=1 Tax=Periplaneta americana TaxID=6978 RepID=UPI0037E8BBCB
MKLHVVIRLGILVILTKETLPAAISKIDAKCVTPQCQDAANEVLSIMDNTTDPCDDFYAFACGHFDESHRIPENKQLWDYFQILQETFDNLSKEVLESPVNEGEPAAVSKAKNTYAACMDTDSLDSRGLEPVVQLLQSWGGWPVLNSSWSQLTWNRMGDIVSEFAVPFVFSISITANLDNANTTAVYLDSPSLSLPTPLLFDEEKPDILQALSRAAGDVKDYPFTKYLIKMAVLLRDQLGTTVSEEDIEKDMVDVVLFMQNLQSAGLSRKSGDTRGLAWTIGQLNQWTKDNLGNSTTMDWLEFLQAAFSKSGVEIRPELPTIFLSGENALGNIIRFVDSTDPRILANYVMGRLLVFLAPESSKEMREAFFDFYVEMGTFTEDYPRWEYCMHKVIDYPVVGFSHAIAYAIKSNYSESIAQASDMVDDLQAAFQELLQENEWMDNATRQTAAEKAVEMLVLLGIPTWCNSGSEIDEFYSKMEVNRSDHFGNMVRLRSFLQNINFETLGKERNRNEWTRSPLVVNAFYNSLNNRITFPIGMMDIPFFSGDDYEKALDYGRIGAIVGHEITHGFDSVGRLYDKFGTEFDWWTNETSAKFDERAQCIVDQYNSYFVPEINKTVDGMKTLRENIADNGGVREAYRAFQKLKLRRRLEAATTPRLPGLEQYSAEQLFFIGYASMWCRAETPAGLDLMQNKDTHSPNRFRVIGSLSNMAEFSEVFECPLGSKMNPEHKCLLW